MANLVNGSENKPETWQIQLTVAIKRFRLQ